MVSAEDSDYGLPTKASQSAWSPSLVIAQLAQQKLAADSVNSVLNPGYMPLASADAERNAGLQYWHQAIRNWYAQQQTAVDYARSGQFDTILEVGVGDYRIFEAQTSLQILLKLIDPASGRASPAAAPTLLMLTMQRYIDWTPKPGLQKSHRRDG